MSDTEYPGIIRGMIKAGWELHGDTYDGDGDFGDYKEYDLFHVQRRIIARIDIFSEPTEEQWNDLVED